MRHDHDLFAIVGDIYDCAIDTAGWPLALGRIGARIGASACVLIMLDPLRRERRMVAQWNVDPAMDEAYQRQFIQVDPTLTLGWFQDIDKPYSVVATLGEAEFTASRLYNGWMREFGFHDNMQTILTRSANRYCGISFLRRHERGIYQEGDLATIAVLAPHIRRAASIADLLDAKTLGHGMLAATLDLLTVGIILVDGDGRIAHANRVATELLDTRSALRRDRDVLSATDARSAAELGLAIAGAALGPTAQTDTSGGALPIACADGQDLAAWVLPLDAGLRSQLAAPFKATVAIFVRSLGKPAPFPGELFVKRYAISPAECRVLMLLTQGMSPAEAAHELGLSLATVKTHMSRLFEKTGTSGQPDLMRLAMSALAPAAM